MLTCLLCAALLRRPAAEEWFAQHGLPRPAALPLAEHLLRIASEPAAIRQLLLSLGDAPPTAAGSGAFQGKPSPVTDTTASPLSTPATSSEDGDGKLSSSSPGAEPAPLKAQLEAPAQLLQPCSSQGTTDASEYSAATAVPAEKEQQQQLEGKLSFASAATEVQQTKRQ